uniref:hypothetical protein n=1 Tax=Bartonella sp. CL63NXGY TaxID=3243538 RepID=UPI0035CF597A
HRQKQPVYAWTVNQPKVMKQMMYNHADGIITDNLSHLQKTIREYTGAKSYANRILNFILVVPSSGGLEP